MNGALFLAFFVAIATIGVLTYRVWTLRQHIHQEAMNQFQSWRATDYEALKTQQTEIATREAQLQLEQWKLSVESTIRSDAIQRSQSVIIGKVTEHVVPYLPDFAFNPKDARFIGSPIDFVVFDGLDRDELQQVVFVEVKSSSSAALTKRERHIRDAINEGRVRWHEIRLDSSRAAALAPNAQGVWWKPGP